MYITKGERIRKWTINNNLRAVLSGLKVKRARTIPSIPSNRFRRSWRPMWYNRSAKKSLLSSFKAKLCMSSMKSSWGRDIASSRPNGTVPSHKNLRFLKSSSFSSFDIDSKVWRKGSTWGSIAEKLPHNILRPQTGESRPPPNPFYLGKSSGCLDSVRTLSDVVTDHGSRRRIRNVKWQNNAAIAVDVCTLFESSAQFQSAPNDN